MHRVLVIEDEDDIVSVVRAYLEREGFEVVTAGDGQAGLKAFATERPDLVVLDLMLPEVDGFEVCRRIRESSDVPVIMLTARVDEIDRVVGLEIGADDYVLKPFSPRELVARLKAVLRRVDRPSQAQGAQVIRVGELEMDPLAHTLSKSGRNISLTPAEFAIMEKMMREPGRTFTRQQLLDAFDTSFLGYERNADTHIKNLRRKLGEVGLSQYIQTVYGVGYKLDVPRA